MFSKQEAFDRIVTGVRRQKCLAFGPAATLSCRYFDFDTKARCHIGLLFTPKEAAKVENEYSGLSVYSLMTALKSLKAVPAWYNRRLEEFYEKLQSVHDANPTTSELSIYWFDNMEQFARKYKLNITKLEAFKKAFQKSQKST
jgi:hypothetical protein